MSFSMMKWFEWQKSPCIEYNGTAYPQLRPEHEIHPSARKHILSYFGESA